MKLKEIIRYEKKLYFSTREEYIKEMLFHSNKYKIYKWQSFLRKEEHYAEKSKVNKFFLLCLIFYRRKKNRLGRMLGFDIPGGVFAPGLRIWHASPIVVNPFAKVGKNAIIVGNLCIGNNKGEKISAEIGDNCTFGWGCAVIGNVKISAHCVVGAGAIVVKDVCEDGAVMAGVPAENIARKIKQ